MADNTTLGAMSGGDVVATDDIGGVKYQRVKVTYGSDGSATDVDATHPLPATTTPVTAEWTGNATGTGTIIAAVDVRGYAAVSLQLVGGSASNFFEVQYSNNNANWTTGYGTTMTAAATGAVGSFVNTYGGIVVPVYGRYMRVQCTAWSSGTTVVTAEGLPVSNPAFTQSGLPVQLAYSGSGQSVLLAGTFSSSDSSTLWGASSSALPVAPVAWTGTAFARQRMATVFKTATATASGDTAAWTPTAGKKFRLMRYLVEVTGDAAISGGGALDIVLRDAAVSLNLGHSLYVPAAGGTLIGGYRSGWVDLGNGPLSAANNNVLNINLSATLTAGKARITCCGIEE